MADVGSFVSETVRDSEAYPACDTVTVYWPGVGRLRSEYVPSGDSVSETVLDLGRSVGGGHRCSAERAVRAEHGAGDQATPGLDGDLDVVDRASGFEHDVAHLRRRPRVSR